MKKLFLILFIGIIALGLGCDTKENADGEIDIEISLSNPEDIAVEFDGYYKINGGAEEAMTGETPQDYSFTLEKGDQVDGIVYKSDSTNLTDTLHIQVSINGEEQANLTEDTTMPTELGGIQFMFSAQ